MEIVNYNALFVTGTQCIKEKANVSTHEKIVATYVF